MKIKQLLLGALLGASILLQSTLTPQLVTKVWTGHDTKVQTVSSDMS